MNGVAQITDGSPASSLTGQRPVKSNRLMVLCTDHEAAMRIMETLTRTNGVRSVFWYESACPADKSEVTDGAARRETRPSTI